MNSSPNMRNMQSLVVHFCSSLSRKVMERFYDAFENLHTMHSNKYLKSDPILSHDIGPFVW